MTRDGTLFLKVREDLLRRIAAGEFPLESQLPTEASLVENYAVSISTVRKAVQTLSDEGIVAKRQGLGTFVTRYPGTIPLPETEAPLNIAALLPSTARIAKEGDSRHWALNLRRLNGICSAAARRHCQVFVHGFTESFDVSNLQGAVMIASYAYSMEAEDARRRLASDFDARGIPYVTVSEFDPRFASSLWVVEMTESEFFRATSSLIERGHRRIALIGPNLDWTNPRYAGYRKALSFHGLGFDERLVVENPDSDEPSGHKACEKLLERVKREKALPPDVVFCTTDLQAYGALSCLAERGIAVPGEIGVLGVDNLAESASCQIPLSSVEFSGPEIGEAAIELLSDARRGKLPQGRMLSCPGHIVWRASVADKTQAKNQ